MARFFRISVTFLQPVYHGRTDGGRKGEWPPSPMRLFQALTAAAFGGCARHDNAGAESLRTALRWIECRSERNPPEIIAPAATPGSPCTLFVPNNDLDIIAKAWARNKPPPKDPAALKTAKVMRPHHLDEPARVHFLWSLEDGDEPMEAATLCRLARRIVALGWGVDLVACDGRIVDQQHAAGLNGERWKPAAGPGPSAARKPVPRSGSLADLERRHAAFLKSVDDEGVYTKPPPPSKFRQVVYRRATDVPSRPFAAFALRPVDPDARSPWRAFRQERAVCIAAMLRHAACEAAKADFGDWRTEEWGRRFVAGHGPDPSRNRRSADDDYPRFSYLTLPTIRRDGPADGMIRRVLIAEPLPQHGGDGRSSAWAALRLAGLTLRDEQTGDVARLEPLPIRDTVLARYVAQDNPARDWVSVTPIILPGYDGKKLSMEVNGKRVRTTKIDPAKRDKLLVKCLQDAGYDLDAVEFIEARPTSWLAASVTSGLYMRPAYLKGLPALHVHLRFRTATAGPIALGAGRHCGLGVFATGGVADQRQG